jgi:hypothetical protein
MSNRKIRKYKLEDIQERVGYASFTRVDIPKGGKVIGVSYHDNATYLHIAVNPENRLKERWFATFEEDMPMEEYNKKTFDYIGMITIDPTLYIFEVYDHEH